MIFKEAGLRGGERRADNPIRTWVRSTLERTNILPEHRISVPFANYTTDISRTLLGRTSHTLVLPPFTTPEMMIVQSALSESVHTVLSNAAIASKVDTGPGFAEFVQNNGGETLSRSPEIKGYFEGITDYYSSINGIQPPKRIVLKTGGLQRTEQELTACRGSYDRVMETITGYTDTMLLYFMRDMAKHPFIEGAVHEWLHHLYEELDHRKGLRDMSQYVDNEHTQSFVTLAHHLGIPYEATGSKTKLDMLNTNQSRLIERVKKQQDKDLDENLTQTMVYEGSSIK